MLLSIRHNFIYIKTHKTASTSVELFLEPLCAGARHVPILRNTEALITRHGIIGARCGGRHRFKDPQHFWNHMGVKAIVERIGEKEFFSYLRVATVRNPFDRLVSMFYFQSETKKQHCPPISTELREAQCQFDAWLHAFNTAVVHRARTDRHLVTLNGSMVMTDFIRAEMIQQDLDKFCQKIDASHLTNIRIGHERNNTASNKHSALELFCTPVLVDIARNIDSWVFDLGFYPDHPSKGNLF